MGAGGSLHSKRGSDAALRGDGVVPFHKAQRSATLPAVSPLREQVVPAALTPTHRQGLNPLGKPTNPLSRAAKDTPTEFLSESEVRACKNTKDLQDMVLRLQMECFQLHRESFALRTENTLLKEQHTAPAPREKLAEVQKAKPVPEFGSGTGSSFLFKGASQLVNGPRDVPSPDVVSPSRDRGTPTPQQPSSSSESGFSQLAGKLASPAQRVMYYAVEGDVAEMEKILDAGQASVDAKDRDGKTALHYACEGGSIEAAKALIKHGASVNEKDNWGETPLRVALHNVNNDVANYIKERLGTVNITEEANPKAEAVLNSRQSEQFCKVVAKKCRIPNENKEDPVFISLLSFCFFVYQDYGVDVTINDGILREILRLSESAKTNHCKAFLSTQRTEKITHLCGVELDENGLELVSKVCMRLGDSVLFSKVLSLHNLREQKLRTTERTVYHLSTGSGVIGRWDCFTRTLNEICEEICSGVNEGVNASYIPELASVDPNLFSVSICTVDGQQFHFGGHNTFTLQSCSKPVLYGATLDLVGSETLHNLVGVEQSGKKYNDLTASIQEGGDKRIPYNAVTNAGAMVTSSLYYPELGNEARFDRFVSKVRDMAGGQHVTLNREVYGSEKRMAYRNYAIANLLMAEGCFPKHVKKYVSFLATFFRALGLDNPVVN